MERATVAFLEEPQNIEEALTCENSKEWECAMQEEYDSLMTKNTWTLVPLPNGKKPILETVRPLLSLYFRFYKVIMLESTNAIGERRM